ncbi:MAG: ABC transporter permease subunit [Gammaproteobacteria bacterium]|nr:ABC transporter permease subunit [Gammaproteobacteria bacterium]
MNSLLFITGDYLRTLMHRRFLLAFLISMFIITLLFYFIIEQFVDDPQIRPQLFIALAIFYAFSSFIGTIAAIYVGASAISGEISRGTIAMLLCRPVVRWQFLLGKLVGALIVMLGYSLIMGGVMVFYCFVHDLDMLPVMRFAPWLTFCQFLMMCSLALALSTVMHPAVAGVLTFFSDLSWVFELFVRDGPFYYVSYVLPSYGPFNAWMDFLGTSSIYSWGDLSLLTLYAFDVALILVLLAMLRLRYKEVT